MKRNEIKALATKSETELQAQLQEINVELSKNKLAKSAGKLANVRLISSLKDDVARIKTILRGRQLKPPAVGAEPETKPKTKRLTKTKKTV